MNWLNRLAISLTFVTLATTAGAASLTPFAATYEVEFSGVGGVLTSTLTRQSAGSYVFENRTRARGVARMVRPRDVVDRSDFSVTGDRLKPLSFTSEDGSRRNKRGSTIDFDWDDGTAASSYKGELNKLPLDETILDRQLMQIAMMRDLAAGKRAATYTVIDRSNVKKYQVEVTGSETVSVPAGQYETLRVERQRPGSSRSTVLWCAPDLDYLPVRMQQLKDGEVIGTLTLQELESSGTR